MCQAIHGEPPGPVCPARLLPDLLHALGTLCLPPWEPAAGCTCSTCLLAGLLTEPGRGWSSELVQDLAREPQYNINIDTAHHHLPFAVW